MVLNKRDLERAFSPKFKPRKVLKTGIENHGTKSNSGASSNIKVYVRIRPFSNQEQTQNQRNTIRVIDDQMLIFDPKEETEGFFFHGVKQKGRDIAKRQNKESQFIFDRVFNSQNTNLDVYEGTTKGIISTLLEGYNCSVFVYGATGAGKTHTMLGNKDNPGITFLTMTELYTQIDALKAAKDFEIAVTYLEVYNETVFDLINPCGPMHLRDDSNGGVLVAGLKVEKITGSQQLFQMLQQGNLNRTQHPTDANAESSRSHAVFQVYVKIKTKASGEVKFAKLSMIDLAGSERGAATGCDGPRFKEGSNINKSLLALGNCINNLADGLRHIPYRDSKLTRLLKDSLGGNCHTIMIANVSPSQAAYEDTYNTFKYATRARSIKSKLTKNVMPANMRLEHYVKMSDELRKENTALKEKMRVLERALTQPAVSPPRADPRYTEKLNHLYRERKQIHTEWLTLESQLKLLQWRIRCKTLTANQMKNQMSQYGFDYNQDFIKNEDSLSQLEARANSLFGKMKELWQQNNKHLEEYNRFKEEMEEAKVTKLLQTEATLKELQGDMAGMQIQLMHYQKLINMQDKRFQDHQSYSDSLSKICSEYYLILSGLNLITDSMDNEYQVGLLKLKGMKAVTWMDLEDGSDDEDGVALSSVSARPFTNLSGIQSCSLPFMVPEMRVKTKFTLPTTEPPEPDPNGTFVLDSEELELQTKTTSNGADNTSKTPSNWPKVPSVQSKPGLKFAMKTKNTPGPVRIKVNGVNKENSAPPKTSINPKYLCPTPTRPKTAVLASRQVNIQDRKTPESKMTLAGLKMIQDKKRTPLHNQHPYVRPIKLKRLGSTPSSAAKSSKSIKL